MFMPWCEEHDWKPCFLFPHDTVYSAWHIGVIQSLGGSFYRKVERRPYTGISPNRKITLSILPARHP